MAESRAGDPSTSLRTNGGRWQMADSRAGNPLFVSPLARGEKTAPCARSRPILSVPIISENRGQPACGLRLPRCARRGDGKGFFTRLGSLRMTCRSDPLPPNPACPHKSANTLFVASGQLAAEVKPEGLGVPTPYGAGSPGRNEGPGGSGYHLCPLAGQIGR